MLDTKDNLDRARWLFERIQMLRTHTNNPVSANALALYQKQYACFSQNLRNAIEHQLPIPGITPPITTQPSEDDNEPV